MRWLILLAALLALLLVGWAFMQKRPQDLPWTTLDLAQPIGLFTGRKLAALTGDPRTCRALLDQAGIAYSAMLPGGEGHCAFRDSVRLKPMPEAVALSPASVAPSCPVAAALKLWEWHVVQPAAQRLLGQSVRTVAHFGSYSCRRMYGRDSGDFSEHATADAIDIAGFVLEDGRRISVVNDWSGEGKNAAFLRTVRDGACGLFSTVLSPDYNAAHRDHFHLDQAERGATGWRACR
ncbi:Extensin-like protein C-terminus [Sphingobium faniae]|nr:Extensin-like protein C-terminus [Sphingobium faniae]